MELLSVHALQQRYVSVATSESDSKILECYTISESTSQLSGRIRVIHWRIVAHVLTTDLDEESRPPNWEMRSTKASHAAGSLKSKKNWTVRIGVWNAGIAAASLTDGELLE